MECLLLARTLLFALLLQSISSLKAAENLSLDADRAYSYLKQVCAIGPRISGTAGMEQQQNLIKDHFAKLGAEIRYQTFDVAHPQNGKPVRMTNMIISWHPDRAKRILIACHYDTRPYPDREPIAANRKKRFIGANDGGSGVALLMELGHHMDKISPKLGVDFVFFDGEELVFKEGDKYFHGSEYFSKEYRDNPPKTFRYEKGVLVDMIGDRDLKIPMEGFSLRHARDVTRSIWATAKRLGVREFVSRRGKEVRDDHVPLNQIAHIPTCDIIDFDYPYWHTRNDIPAACSGDSLAKVGRVLLAWLNEN